VRDVVLLTKDECHFCDEAKRVLARFADDGQLAFREVRLDSEEGRQLATNAGVPFPPVIFLDGEYFSYGRLSERKLRKALR
jgi:glutaredoxin